MSGIAAFVRGWFTEPAPTFESRTASARWATTQPRHARHVLRVAAVIDETPSTRTFVLSAPDGGKPALAYRAGQHLTLLVDAGGATQRRCYSFSSSPLSGALPAITVKRAADGIVSRHLHEQVHVGDTLTALEPTGEFTLATDAHAQRHLVLVAGGVGITPLVEHRRDGAARRAGQPRHPAHAATAARTRSCSARGSTRSPPSSSRGWWCDTRSTSRRTGWNGLHGALDGARVLGALDARGRRRVSTSAARNR